MKNTTIKSVILALTVVVLPGCSVVDTIKEKLTGSKEESKPKAMRSLVKEAAKDGGKVLCSINGTPVITEKDFNQSIQQMLQANPYFRGAGAESLPASIKKKFFDELVKQKVIITNAQESGLQKDPKFIEAYEDMKKLVKDSLTVQFFEKEVFEGINASDNDAQKYFNENKEQFVKVAGGVLVSGARFENEADANAFKEQAKGKSEDEFNTLAKANSKAKLKSFGRVNKAEEKGFGASSVPGPIKDTAFALMDLPAVEKVKVAKEFWVIHVSDKEETTYFALDEIKPQILNILKNNQFREKLDEKLKAIKANMNISSDEEFFKDSQKSDLEALAEQFKKAAQASGATEKPADKKSAATAV
ncbi:peptidyl-prolyl cis-trans isomerase [Candidatus Babeliales bacterium]|nr:peptidyl-prolyl cis-trans isomerase [Candidatus Babeliales bacterium]